jgi:type IV pilus assembly protein PilM
MAAASESVWAIDIGNSSLKALRLSTESGALEVVDFDNIRHGKILSGGGITDAEKDELIAFSLRQFVNKHDFSEDDIIVSVPSQSSFARFVNLPPVEPKRITEIVKFEAVQQIPFDIDDVQWDWQRMSEDDSAELKVGIFAIKNDIVNTAIEHFTREDIQVSYVQMAPMALYNYILHDRPDLVNSDTDATVVLNVGAEITDLVVCTKSSVWQRCILLGGNSFSKAIADTFHLDFEKAEKLKRTAPVSKYARQIFQAMRPVFMELAVEVQKSLGFYKSSNPGTRVRKVVAIGGGTKLRGLLKYLQQTLQMPVERPDVFKRLRVGSEVPAAKFGENVSEFGVVYGLGLQALGMAGIESNLLPQSMIRSMAWAGKSRCFLFAACLLLAVSAMVLGRTLFDKINYTKNNPIRVQIQGILNEDKQARQNLADTQLKITQYKEAIAKKFEPLKYREVIPQLYETIFAALPNAQNNPMQANLYAAFARGDIDAVMQTPRNQRMQIFVTNMSVKFAADLSTASFTGASDSRAARRSYQPDMYFGYEEYEYMSRRGDEFGRDSMSRPSEQQPPQASEPNQAGENLKKEGFIVTLSGYSPYENIQALIDPLNVSNRPDRWGFVTRLMHLADASSPFELYEKANTKEHFKLEIGEVDIGRTGTQTPMPAGIGEIKQIVEEGVTARTRSGTLTSQNTAVLIDPMTKEVISKIQKLDPTGAPLYVRGTPDYQVNDHWFELSMKFAWRGGPDRKQADALLKSSIPQGMGGESSIPQGMGGEFPIPQRTGRKPSIPQEMEGEGSYPSFRR